MEAPSPEVAAAVHPARSKAWAYVEIARVDHWFKNVFVIPGVMVGLWVAPQLGAGELLRNILLGFASICLTASSNYTLNEVLDAPADRHHPTKHTRPVVAGRVSVPLAYLQWIGLAILGVALALAISWAMALTIATLWIMGCVYNMPPMRTKDIPYVDVLTESVNNPLRLMAGWYIVDAPAVPPGSLLLSYWMIGCYFMAVKRFAELRRIDDPETAGRYRKAFRAYTPERLLVSIVFYASASMLFLGVFIMRYRLELVLSFPMISLLMAQYIWIGFKADSAAQRPEALYRERGLVVIGLLTTAVVVSCLAVDMPWLAHFVAPLYPIG